MIVLRCAPQGGAPFHTPLFAKRRLPPQEELAMKRLELAEKSREQAAQAAARREAAFHAAISLAESRCAHPAPPQDGTATRPPTRPLSA